MPLEEGFGCLELCLYGIRIGGFGFHAGKGSIYSLWRERVVGSKGSVDGENEQSYEDYGRRKGPSDCVGQWWHCCRVFFFYFDSLLTFTKWQLEIGGWSVSVWDPDTSSWKSRMTNISSFVMSSWLPCTLRRILFLHWLIMQMIVSWNINGTTYSNFIFERLLLQQILN